MFAMAKEKNEKQRKAIVHHSTPNLVTFGDDDGKVCHDFLMPEIIIVILIER